MWPPPATATHPPQFAVHLYVLVEAAALGARHARGPPPEVDGDFEPSTPNTVVWLISSAMLVTTFAVNYKGKPYMEGLAANRGLLLTLGASALAIFGLAQGSLPEKLGEQ